ncbi:hypothetical protein L2729_18940 [Shewanella gelidimarina]|uniref:hypothetical protein n=1 Tax=Shewanella gelidimarina TaxID=56813 RepID=UPI00200D6AD8|nr:hypothetical protein [Shewanella gelidimarina]MCL1060050.1 hypothetical protein [Shewanella gelidimarina]
MLIFFKVRLLVILSIFLISGCNVANHGSFTSKTYQTPAQQERLVNLGPVVGESCQTQFLYLVPIDGSVSTLAAINQAKQKIEGTVILADMIIDDTLSIQFGYSEQCISVHAIAYGSPVSD